MTRLDSTLAREAARPVRWREEFWRRRYQGILFSVEDEAQADRLADFLAPGLKEVLVA